MTRRWRVKLPEGVRPPFEVYINGVRQELGVDFQVSAGQLVFERELVQQKLGAWAWFIGAWGIGTYKRNDEVDVRYELGGRPMLAHALAIIPPGGSGSDDFAADPRPQQPQRRQDRPRGR